MRSIHMCAFAPSLRISSPASALPTDTTHSPAARAPFSHAQYALGARGSLIHD